MHFTSVSCYFQWVFLCSAARSGTSAYRNVVDGYVAFVGLIMYLIRWRQAPCFFFWFPPFSFDLSFLFFVCGYMFLVFG